MNRNILLVFFLLTGITGFSPIQAADLLAFPGAEGFGRYTLGARAASAPQIYHVTNLNDSGTGSFRDAVSEGGRIVVFDVSGIINLESTLIFSGNSVIAGQTAPGGGVMLYGDRVSFSSADNLIIRYLRIRMGVGGTSGKDAAGVANGKNMIFDHLSVTWGRDETFSINWDSKGTEPGNITIQNTIIGQGLQTHSCGGLVQTDGGVTLFRNLYIDNKTRNPKVKGLNQFVNNVVYNWGGGGGYIMGGSAGDSWATIEDNYFIKGPSTGSTAAFVRSTETFQVYEKNNMLDYDLDGNLDGTAADASIFSGATVVSSYSGFSNSPQTHPAITAQTSAAEAYAHVVKDVGASYPVRDEVDTYLINQLTSLGTKGALISDESELGLSNNVGTLASGSKPRDTDNDGMPDDWEDANGLNKNDASDAVKVSASGYLNIELYINGLVTESTSPKLTQSSGAADQTILLGDSIASIAYAYVNCVGATATGLPAGVSAKLNTSDGKLYISGTPTQTGTFNFTVTTSGGSGDAASLSGTITVVTVVTAVLPPAEILSSLNAAYPGEGEGAYEDKNTGWIDSGYYNVTNTAGSYAIWKLNAENPGKAALVIRYANGGTASRNMALVVNGVPVGAVVFPATGSWTLWDSVCVTVTLVRDLNTLQLTSMTADGGPNLDEFEFDVAGVTLWKSGTTALPGVSSFAGHIAYNPVQGILRVPVAGFAEVEILDLQGRCTRTFARFVQAGENLLSIDRNSLPQGMYWVRVRFGGLVVCCTKWANAH